MNTKNRLLKLQRFFKNEIERISRIKPKNELERKEAEAIINTYKDTLETIRLELL